MSLKEYLWKIRSKSVIIFNLIIKRKGMSDFKLNKSLSLSRMTLRKYKVGVPCKTVKCTPIYPFMTTMKDQVKILKK